MSAVIHPFRAGAAINKFCAVKINAYTANAVEVIAATATTDAVIGIAQTTVVAGEDVGVCIFGETYVVANGAFTLGDLLCCVAAAGLVDTAGAAARAFGIALQTATAQNDQVKCLVGVGVGQSNA